MKRYFCFFSEILKSIENYKMPSRKELLRIRKEEKRLAKLAKLRSAPPPEPEPEPEPQIELPVCETCIYIIQRGKRKGQECGKKCKEGLYCSLHTEKGIEY